MERSVAIKKLSKLLGKSVGYRVDQKAPTPEARAAAKSELPAVQAEKNRLNEALTERSRELLNGDPEYVRLREAYKKTRKETERLSWMTHRYKFTVGTTNGMFFVVRGEGDSWEEVIAKVQAKSK